MRGYIHPQIKNIESVVVAENVVHLFGLNAFVQVNVCINYAFLINHWVANGCSVWPDDAGKSRVFPAKHGLNIRHIFL